MRDLNLAYTYERFGKYAIRWTTLCPNLEKLNLERAYLTLQDIDALANFKNLKEVNFSRVFPFWMSDRQQHSIAYYRNSFHKLFSSCQRLEKIDLSFNHKLTDHELETLSLCKNLKCLKLIAVSDVPDIIFLQCPKLEVIHVSRAETKHLTNQWNERYQHITIVYYEGLFF
ncbi:uncharacterized protein LOC120358519 [Solenopsis invicta]|uniref:uncharacterized protein LOC120358519 n=1 Tax=Solenopsis invicta TaxID=13686 RepID=UPI00193CCEA9|nr:uncharacterized protein LOC120358519 [Solenopsis invicta]